MCDDSLQSPLCSVFSVFLIGKFVSTMSTLMLHSHGIRETVDSKLDIT